MKKMTYAKLLSVTVFASVALIIILTSGKAAAASFCGCGMLSQVNASNSDANCEDENDASCNGHYPGYTIANQYGSNSLESGGNEANIKSNFIRNLQWFAGQHPYQQISAAWIESRLGGGNWAARINSASVTLKLENYSFGQNTMYMPADNGGKPSTTNGSVQAYSENGSALAIVIYVNGVVYDAVKADCGNMVGSWRPLPPPNSPPYGNFTQLVCNAAAETYTIRVNFGDPDGGTTAELRAGGGKQWGPVGGNSYTWTIPTTQLPPGDFPVELWVRDVGQGADNQYHKVDTAGFANCDPQGNISTVGNCYQVSLKLWDPNEPFNNINYYLDINGTKDGTYSFGGQGSGNATVDVYDKGGFDQWSTNQVTLIGVDRETGGQVNLGTTTINAVCAQPICGGSSIQGQTYAAGENLQLSVWMGITSSAPALPTSGPKASNFSYIRFETLNKTSYPYSFGGGKLTSSPPITYAPPTGGTFDTNYAFFDGENGKTYPCTSTSPTQIVYQPYFRVLGGDVSAGQGFETGIGSGCTDNNNAAIKGYNTDTSNKYFGASSSQAAIATGAISQFATDTTNDYSNNLGGSTDGMNRSPIGLAFANSGMPSGNTYGGNFLAGSGAQWCVPNYVTSVTGPTDYTFQPSWNTLPAKPNGGGYIVRLAGNQTLGNIQIPAGVHVTVIVTGNVYINGDIKYGGYSNQPTIGQTLASIPQFNLLVSGGDISVDPGVSELHGFYDAQPGGPNTGEILTCASGYGLGSVVKSYAQCSPPLAQNLTFYGAVSAAEIVPGRTEGNIVKTSSVMDDPAEQFVYSPELWLGSTSGPTTSCATDPTQANCMYQSYTSLPPVL